MAIAEEKVLSANGKVAASPWITVAFEPFTRAPSFAANAWSYSRLVTRAARRLNSSVAAPGPRPVPAHAHPVASLAKSKAKLGAASPTATAAFHKTTFRIDSLGTQQNSKAANSTVTEVSY